MIQDIHPHAFDVAYRRREPASRDRVFVALDGKVLLCDNGEDHFLPHFETIASAMPDAGDHVVYLFAVDDTAFFLLSVPLEGELDGYSYHDPQEFRTFPVLWLGFAGITACHLAQWYAKNRFCGTCATALRRKEDERALECPECGMVAYPGISPAVIVGVTDGDKLLMTRYANQPYSRPALVAGFMEIGETLEDTVRREVMEEVGVGVKNIRYYKSQPWAFSCSVLVGFFADLDGSPEITLDTNELQEAFWMERKDIPPNDVSVALTAEMMEMFRLGTFPH